MAAAVGEGGAAVGGGGAAGGVVAGALHARGRARSIKTARDRTNLLLLIAFAPFWIWAGMSDDRRDSEGYAGHLGVGRCGRGYCGIIAQRSAIVKEHAGYELL